MHLTVVCYPVGYVYVAILMDIWKPNTESLLLVQVGHHYFALNMLFRECFLFRFLTMVEVNLFVH